MTGSHVGYQHGNKERIDTRNPAFLQHQALFLEYLYTADTGTDQYPGPIRINLAQIETGIFQS